MSVDYKAIGNRVKNARMEAGFSQELLAEKASISLAHLRNIENGTAHINLKTIFKLAVALNTTPDNILCDNLTHTQTKFERELFTLLRQFNEDEICFLIQEIAKILATRCKETPLNDSSEK